MSEEEITPELLLNAYAQGYFPMAQAEDDPDLLWFYPQMRGIIPLGDEFHISRSNKRLFRNHKYEISLDRDFRGVMEQCRRARDGCWISDRIIDLYCQTHEMGFAHSVECWNEGELMGGIYGIALGGAFFGESMFSRQSGASKIALITLADMLYKAGYVLFDVQYVNEHLKQLKVIEISCESYLQRLDAALNIMPHKLNISSR